MNDDAETYAEGLDDERPEFEFSIGNVSALRGTAKAEDAETLRRYIVSGLAQLGFRTQGISTSVREKA